MSQQQPGYGPPQQPGWGAQQHPQQPTQWRAPQQPGWGAPPPQPPKKTPIGKILGFGCLGVLALFVVFGIIGAIASDSSSSNDSKGNSVSTGTATTDAGSSEDKAADAQAEKDEPAPEPPVKVTAKKTAFAPSILAEGSAYTSVMVTVTNNSDEEISVNPLYFAITDSKGTKHSAELAVDENQINTVKLAPGENVSGTITGKGAFTAKTVTYTDSLLGDPVRVPVS